MTFLFKKIIFAGAVLLSPSLLAVDVNYDSLRKDIMDSFTDSAQSHYPDGQFEWYSDHVRVLGDEDGKLDFKKDTNTWSSAFTCGAKKCEVTGHARDAVALPNFEFSNKQISYSSYNECRKGIGSLSANKEYQNIEIGNCKVSFPSGIKAGALSVNNGGVIVLEGGNYWFESFQLNNDAELRVNGAVTIFVKNHFHLNSSAKVNADSYVQDLLFVSYNENNIALDNNARLNGFLYSKGSLALNGKASIAGRVNVKNLTLNNQALIEGAPAKSNRSDTLHHYEIHYNTCSESLVAKACANESCSELYPEKAKLHVKADGSNLVNFNHIYGSESKILNKTPKYPFTMVVQSDGKGGNMDPDTDNPLVCYVNGKKTCTVTDSGSSGNSGPLSFQVDTAYAAGQAPVRFTGGCLAAEGHIEVEFSLDDTTSGNSETAILSWPGGSTSLAVGESQILTLPVTGTILSYAHADRLSLSVQQMLQEEKIGSRLFDEVAFVPKAWQVQQIADCGDNDGFIYRKHAASCTVLGAVGETARFSVAALDVNDNKLPLGWLDKQPGLSQLVEATLDNGSETRTVTFALNGQGETLSQHELDTGIIGRLGIQLASWTAPYIPAHDSPLVTEEHSGFIGRTVPASLHIVETVTGDIEGNVAYAGQPKIPFSTEPSFTLVGRDINGNALPSYSGEFAGGLESNITLNLETGREHNDLNWYIQEPETGRHVITLDTERLRFHKTAPFPQTPLNLPLGLAINSHDGTRGGSGETPLAQENDSLRFGFVGLMDTELKVGEPGAMASKLFYFGNSITTFVEDSNTHYDFGGGATVAYKPVPSPELALSLAPRGVEVGAYGRQHQGTRVTVEGLPDWLKPEVGGVLTDPSAMLDILDNSRKRANDSTFNRREVIR